MDGLLNALFVLATAVALGLLLKPAWSHFGGMLRNWRLHRDLRRALPASHYRILRDIPAENEQAGSILPTQIDHAVVSPCGIFIITVLHGSGAVRGSVDAAEWVWGRFRSQAVFPNPLHRNRRYIGALSRRLDLPAACFHSLVVFTGRVEFTTAMPVNVTRPGGVVPFIQIRTREVLPYEEVHRASARLARLRPKPGIEAAAAHLAALRMTEGPRFGARQATLGLALMATLLLAAGSLIHRLGEMPGRYPDVETLSPRGPFLVKTVPPRIDLPGTPVARESPRPAGPAALANSAVSAVMRDPEPTAPGPQPAAGRAATQSPLFCAYSAESRRCACYEPEGRKVELDYDSCRRLADQRSGDLAR